MKMEPVGRDQCPVGPTCVRPGQRDQVEEPLGELRRPEDWNLTHVREALWRSNGLRSPVENSECVMTKHTFSQESGGVSSVEISPLTSLHSRPKGKNHLLTAVGAETHLMKFDIYL